jgi:hypothetical protein
LEEYFLRKCSRHVLLRVLVVAGVRSQVTGSFGSESAALQPSVHRAGMLQESAQKLASPARLEDHLQLRSRYHRSCQPGNFLPLSTVPIGSFTARPWWQTFFLDSNAGYASSRLVSLADFEFDFS